MGVEDADGHKADLHPERIVEWKQTGSCYPLQVEVGPTDKCNHRCGHCTLDWITHGSSEIDKDVMLSALEEMASIGVKAVYWAGEGEPLLHKDIGSFVKRTKDLGMGAALSTNVSLLTKDKAKEILPYLNWIRYSVDASSPETYSQIHRVPKKEFSKVVKNIYDSVEIKKQGNYDVEIGIQAILMPTNLGEMEDLVKLSRDMGVDNFQLKPAHNHPKSSYAPSLYQFSHDELKNRLDKYTTSDFTVVVRTKTIERLFQDRVYKECFGFYLYSLISAKGDVIPCNVFYDKPEFFFGNLYKNSFKEILQSDQRKQIMDKITNFDHKMCGNYICRLDVLNRYLWRLKNPQKNDIFC